MGAALLLVAVVGYVEFRRGFVRHDAHTIPFFLAGALLPLAVRWPGRVAGAVGVGVSGAWVVALGFAIALPVGTMLGPGPRVTALRKQTSMMLTSDHREKAELAAKDDIRRAVGLGPAVLAEIGDHTVHVDPWETSAVWAYGLNWLPEPVFQSYLAYTPELDQENADLLVSAGGPERVLRHLPAQAIDGRNPLMDDPLTEVALVCNYDEAVVEGEWQVLRKGPNRCGAARPLEHLTVRSGEEVPVPAVADDELLVMRLDLGSSLAHRLQAALFKPSRPDKVVLDQASYYRLVTGNAGGPLLLCLPPATGYSEAAITPCPTTLAVLHGGSITIDFSAIRLRPAPVPTPT
jgi:hypothetical protein